jgi:hypothetical protein
MWDNAWQITEEATENRTKTELKEKNEKNI